MGTHPIFESDFDCLTEYVELGFARAYRKCPARAQSQRSGPGRLGGWFGRVVWDARYCPLEPFRLFAVDETCGAAVGGVEWGEYAQMLSTNPTLKRIDMRWNRIGATAGREILDALKHNTTIESVLLDGNGLTADLVDSIRLIADRNSVAHQIHQKSQDQTSFLLDELEQTKSVALQESTRFNSEREITHHQRVELEANLWANKNVLIELRGKLEIAEATVAERKAQVDDMHH